MSQTPFTRSLFISACVSGMIFSAAAVPFSMLKSNVVGLELQNRNIYSAELKYLAAPYLGLAGGVSVAVGLGVFGLMGWRQSARRVAQAESAHQEMARSLAIHQAELERIKFSEARLRSQNLSTFLQPEMAPVAGQSAPAFREGVALEVAIPRAEVRVPQAQPGLAMASLPRPAASAEVAVESHRPVYDVAAAASPEPLDNLLHQLHQLSKQVEELRGGNSNRLAA